MTTYTTHQRISASTAYNDTDLFIGILEPTEQGAAVRANGAVGSLTVTGSTFTSNSATAAGMFGGAIWSYAATFTINSSSSAKPYFIDNFAETGGAIFNNNGCTFSVTDAVFHGNVANNTSAGYGGGAIYNDIKTGNAASFNVYGSTFSANSAANSRGRGGAIDTWGDNNFSTNNLFIGNYAEEWGGAVDFYNKFFDDGSTFSNNLARKGGAIANNNRMASTDSTGTFTKSQFNANSATEGGGAANFDNGNFLFSSASFAGNVAPIGGAILTNGAVGTVSNSYFTANSATNGAAIAMASAAATLGITGSTFTENVAENMGGGVYLAGSLARTLTVDDSTFSRNLAANGAAIVADGWSAYRINIQNSRFDANTATASAYGGGAFYQYSNGASITIAGSTFTDNVASYGGAASSIRGSVDVSNSLFTGNSASVWGGALCEYGESGKLNVSNSTFTSNYAADAGGAVAGKSVNGGASTISIVSGVFTSNTAVNAGGAVYAHSPSSVAIDGASFSANSANLGGALFANANATSTIINAIFTGNTAATAGAIYNAGTLGITGGLFNGNHSAQGGALGNFGSSKLTVDGTTFSENGADLGGVIYVYGLSGATFTNAIVVNNTATNGGAVRSGGGIYITGGLYDGNTAEVGGAIFSAGVGTIQGGTFSHNSITAGGKGGAIFAQNSLTINGTLFEANSASKGSRNGDTFGGGLYIDSANVTVTGATFAKNYTDNMYGGAGIYTNTNCTVSNILFQENTGVAGAGMAAIWVAPTITGSTFTANSVSEYGAGFFKIASSNTASFASILASTFTGNVADLGGGALAGKNLLIDGSVFERNTAANGGAYYMYPHDDGWAIGTVSNSLFTANTASTAGGAVYMGKSSSNDTLTVSGSTFTDNVANVGGGAIYMTSSPHSLSVSGSTFSRNTAKNGGAIMTEGWSAHRVNIQNSVFDANTVTDAEWGGGAIYQYSNTSQFNISGSTFTNNVASHGGAFASIRGDINFSTSLFEGNTASTMGGAIMAHGENCNLTVSGSTFTNNYSDGNGGAIAGYSANDITSIISLDNVTFSGNTAAVDGGALYARSRSTVTIKDSTFATESDTVLIEENSDLTMEGSLVFNGSLSADAVKADDLTLTFGSEADSTIGAITTVEGATAGLAAVNFNGLGKVTFDSQDLSAVAITVTRNDAGEYVVADGISDINTSITVNGTATTLTSGNGTSASSDGLLAQVVSFADSALNLTVYDELYVGFGIQDATHFDTTTDLQATYAGYNGTIIVASTVIVDSTNTLDDALAATETNPGIIAFAAETDGTTCTFSGDTIGHDQFFRGNGADKTNIQAANANMVFANGNDVSFKSLAWSGIIYGGALNNNTTATSLAFKDASVGGNVFGGGRANTGSTIADGAVSLAITDSTQTAGKAVYGGAYANGGTATAESVSLTLTDVNAGTNSVYGGGAVNNGGALEVGPVSTKIEGGVYGAVYNGANIYTAGTGSAFGAGAMNLEINGGTFSGAVGNGSTPRAGASSTQGASTLAITDGLFSGPVYGGAASFGGNATVASTTVTISGGTFNGKVFGGNVGQTGAKAANTSLTGNANLTIDSTAANIYFNGNVYGGSMGTGNVGGNVTVTLKGDGDKLHFASGSFVSGASEYAYGAVADYVEGTKTLVFDGFVQSFSGNVQGPAFDTVTIKNGSYVRLLGAGQNQDFSFASTWNFELEDASAVMTTDEIENNHAKNSFYGDTINITFADGAASVVAGTDWTVYTGRADTTAEWNNLTAVTIDGVAATGAMDGAYMAWTTDDYKVYLDGNYDIRLAKLAIA